MYLQVIVWGRDWNNLAQDRGHVVGTCGQGNKLSASIKSGNLTG
jgi:hypothetical protein